MIPPKIFHQNGHWNKDFISISLPQPPNATWTPLWKIENALFWQDRKLVCNMKCRWNKTRFIILSHDNWASVTQCCVSMFFGTAQQKTYCSQLWLTYKQSFTNILQNIIKQLNMAALLYRWQIHQKSWHRFDIPSFLCQCGSRMPSMDRTWCKLKCISFICYLTNQISVCLKF